MSLESTTEALKLIERVGIKSRISEGRLREAVCVIADRIALWVGVACDLCDGYRIVNLDPQLEVDGYSRSARYLVLTYRHDTVRRVGIERAIGRIPDGAWGGEGIAPATRAELVRFAADISSGLLDRVLDIVARNQAALAKAATRVEFAQKKLERPS